MFRQATIPFALMLALAGCAEGDGSNPFSDDSDTDTGTDTETEITIPADVAGDLTSMSYDATAGTLTVTGVSQDEVPFEAIYTRKAALDSQYGGYQVFMAQDDALDRHATALVMQSDGTVATGRVRAGISVTGGPRNRYYGGGYYERDGEYDPPEVTTDSGMVSYAGSYAGLTNIGVQDYSEGILIEPDASVPTELRPSRSAQTTGDIYLNADFADNTVEGNIYNRELTVSGQSLPSLVLISSDIDSDGTFSGTVEYDSAQSDSAWQGMSDVVGASIGNYAGIFGGTDASGVGGAVQLDQFDGTDDRLGLENEEEYGVFVLEKCGTAGSSASICSDANP